MLTLPPLSLYVHIPWCERKCPYCDFNSHVSGQALPEADYITKLLQNLEQQLPWVQGRKLTSIFFGGGTPSLLAAQSIQRFLDEARNLLPFADDIEITLEANPGSSEQEKFAALHAAGVNRLSLGIQSFHDQQLQALGRIHCAEEALNAVSAAQQAGFQRINIDLMHGLPGQTLATAMGDLQQAIATGVEHISWYQLTIEQNTEFFRYPPPLPDEEVLIDIHDAGSQLLAEQGFGQYEISAFCRTGQMARHNLNYWQYGDYLAVGAGAHGKITLPEENRILRFNNTRLPKDYLSRDIHFHTGLEAVDGQDRLFECLMNCLRLKNGMPVADCLAYTGQSRQNLLSLCQPLVTDGLLQLDSNIKTTALGYRHLNSVLENLL